MKLGHLVFKKEDNLYKAYLEFDGEKIFLGSIFYKSIEQSEIIKQDFIHLVKNSIRAGVQAVSGGTTAAQFTEDKNDD